MRPGAPAPGTRILGVDPGSRFTGWGLLAGNRTPRLVDQGVIRLDSRVPLAERLAGLHARLSEIVRRLLPDCAAVETPFKGVNPRSAIQLAQARGVILAALGTCEVPVFEYSPAAVKKAITGNGRAEKIQVGRMVAHLLPQGLPEGAADDLTDAVAVALCHVGLERFGDAVRRAEGAGPGPAPSSQGGRGGAKIRRPVR